MSLFVKICGITTPEDGIMAAECGARALGFNFYPRSKRYVTQETAKEICDALPPDVLTVGVFVNKDAEVVQKIQEKCGLDLVQFHGDETPAYCTRFGDAYIRALRPQNVDDLRCIKDYPNARMILIDAFSANAYGGTGEKADWICACAAKEYDIPLLLAGGLTPENVAYAITAVQPFGVDVASGVEAEPGRKSEEKIRHFMREVRRACESR